MATATPETYTLSLHDALPISATAIAAAGCFLVPLTLFWATMRFLGDATPDRKSTRLNSSHTVSSYAVFCLKKKSLGLVAGRGLRGVHGAVRSRDATSHPSALQ